jgi:hypothetical protein
VKKLIATAALLMMVSANLSAQNADPQHRGQGYLFLGVGSGTDLPSFEHVGGGGEVLLFRGLGVGGELGAMGRPGEGVGVFSIDASYHFLHVRGRPKLVPFVEGGYTRTFGNKGFTLSENLFNFGGGIHYWVFNRVGLRLEFRDYVAHEHFFVGVTDQYWGLRVGLALR